MGEWHHEKRTMFVGSDRLMDGTGCGDAGGVTTRSTLEDARMQGTITPSGPY